jgi:hypothetical protein
MIFSEHKSSDKKITIIASANRLPAFTLSKGILSYGFDLNKRVIITNPLLKAVLRIRICMVFGFLDPDPDPDLLVRGTNPDPSITKQK